MKLSSNFYPEVKRLRDRELTPEQTDGFQHACPRMPRYNEGRMAGTHQGMPGGSHE